MRRHDCDDKLQELIKCFQQPLNEKAIDSVQLLMTMKHCEPFYPNLKNVRTSIILSFENDAQIERITNDRRMNATDNKFVCELIQHNQSTYLHHLTRNKKPFWTRFIVR